MQVQILLVLFMITTALSLREPANLTPWAPAGASGVMHGAIGAFFGFLGFDEVCLLSMETRDPHRNVPLSLMISIAVVTAVYAAAALALSGVVPNDQLDPDRCVCVRCTLIIIAASDS
jgi:basic amino acid/polyamine antiporter, APA family